jgi:hypothetical protein
LEDAATHRRRHDRTGVDQHFRGCRAGERAFTRRVACVAVGSRGDAQHAAVIIVIATPGEQRRVIGQQLLQPVEILVVDDASCLRYRRLEAVRT